MNNHFVVTAYLIYLPVALLLTWYVARILFRSGIVFMRDIFFGREEIAAATNALFRIGFYLFNVGYALYILQIYIDLSGTQGMIEILSAKIGGFCIYLGFMLFLNMYLFFRGKKAAKRRHELSLATQNTVAVEAGKN